jgi:REP element-mobilizing transposase RayT
MARPLRVEYPGAVYHVTSRGNARKKIFSDDQDREIFLSILGAVVKRYNWACHAYCLMDNHYHFMIETPDANLSIGMRQLNGIYTQKYNRRHHKPGHIFQGRFKAILVQKVLFLGWTKVNSRQGDLWPPCTLAFSGGALTPPSTKGMLHPFGNPAIGSPQQAAGYF